MMDLFIINTKLFTRRFLMDWSGVDYCDVFISCLDSHSDGTHSLRMQNWYKISNIRITNLFKVHPKNKTGSVNSLS